MASSKPKYSEGLKFIESIIFIILIIVTIIANTYGNIYLKLIPLLFFLGIVGRIVYLRPVITSVFGGAFSIVTTYINGTYSIGEILMSSVTNTVLILCGEIFAMCLITCINDFKKKKNKDIKIKNIIISILFFILSVYITLYLNGNILKYKDAENRLKEYLNKNYSEIEFATSGYRYIPFKDRGYSFKVENLANGAIYKFIVYERKEIKIYDGFETNVIKNKNIFIKDYLSKNVKLPSVTVEAEYEKYDEVDISIKYVATTKDYKDDLVKSIIQINSQLLLYGDYKDIFELKVIVEDTNKNKLNAVYFKFDDYCKQLQEQSEYYYLDNILDVEFFDF